MPGRFGFVVEQYDFVCQTEVGISLEASEFE